VITDAEATTPTPPHPHAPRFTDKTLSELSGFGASTEEDLLQIASQPGETRLTPYLGIGRLSIGDRIRLGEETCTIASLGTPATARDMLDYTTITLRRPLREPHAEGTPIVRIGKAVALRAVWEDGAGGALRQFNAPQPIWVPTLGQPRWFRMSWLGCRCSWPCTQLCWLSACACGASQQLAAIWSILTIAFELILLDALVSQMFIQNCPNRITEWEDYLIAPMPIAQRVAAIATYTVFPLLVVGYLAGTSANKLVLTFADGVEKETNADRSVYAILYQARIVLRSLAARRESGTYAYCSTIFYAIVIEIHTVVIPAYLIFVAPAIVMFAYDATLHHIAKFYIVFTIIQDFNSNGLYFLTFALCLSPETIAESTRFVAGKRALEQTRSVKYFYTWVLLCGMWAIVFLLKLYYTMLFLWLLPIFIVIYGVVIHAFPYCFSGITACPPHTGPAVEFAGILTLAVFLAWFCFARACFLFPCLCAPEVPGWLFFPPNEPPDSPVQGDVDSKAFLVLLHHLRQGLPVPEDCVWEPPGWTPITGARLPPEGSKG